MSIFKYACYTGVLVLGLGGLICSSAGNSWAGTANSPLSVTAIVLPSVSVDTTPVNNITYDATGSNAQSQITVTASSGSSLTIRIGEGINPDSGSTPSNPVRRMKSNQGNYLNYQITTDANHTDNWGNTTDTGVTLTGTGSAHNITFYFYILPNQNVPAGNYTDTVQMTTDY